MALARSYGCRCDGISILPIGLSASINCGDCHDKKLIPVYLAGPAANILLFVSIKATMMLLGTDDDNFRLICQTNLYLALFNMIPAYPLDGGRILMAALAGRMGLISAGRLIRRIALAVSIGIVLWGTLDSPASVGGASLVMIGLFMISSIKKSRTECAFMNIKQIIYRRTKLLARGIYPARELVVMKNTMLSAVINYMDHDSFHLISVLDDKFGLIGICTENDIMEAMTDENVNMTFEQLLNKQKEKEGNRQS
jgi:stage IV sporulation protein FB